MVLLFNLKFQLFIADILENSGLTCVDFAMFAYYVQEFLVNLEDSVNQSCHLKMKLVLLFSFHICIHFVFVFVFVLFCFPYGVSHNFGTEKLC